MSRVAAWILRNTYYRNRLFEAKSKDSLVLFNVYQLNKLKGLEAIYLGNGKFALW